MSIENTLLALREELQNRIARIESEQQARHEQAEWSDQGSVFERDDEQFALKQAARAEIEQINGALSRITQGRYGRCVVCEEAISPARLHALPYTAYCSEHTPN